MSVISWKIVDGAQRYEAACRCCTRLDGVLEGSGEAEGMARRGRGLVAAAPCHVR